MQDPPGVIPSEARDLNMAEGMSVTNIASGFVIIFKIKNTY
jgi:hypothetical protein